MKHKNILRKGFSVLFILMMVLSAFQGLITPQRVVQAQNNNNSVTEIQSGDSSTQIRQDGCDLIIHKTQETEWTVPRKPIDLVILQDTSGSFQGTIERVQSALLTLTTPVDAKDYDPDNPRLVFTDNPRTTDRVMVASFQGLDGRITYDNWDTASSYRNGRYNPGYTPDSNFTDNPDFSSYVGGYHFRATNLVSDAGTVQNFITNFAVDGGTPTVPAIEDVIARYQAQVRTSVGGMDNDRKTVFLLITDGVANGVRRNGQVVIEYSGARIYQLLRDWNLTEAWSYMEASQNILARAQELRTAGERLKEAAGPEGSVVVGFWEDVEPFTRTGQYGPTYLNGFGNTSVNFGDNRSVQTIFSEALRSVASPDKEVNGKQATFYVNEQHDINVFANKVLESVGAALIKDDVKGSFEITSGYKVKSVSINEKEIVDTVTDRNSQIRGTITQVGDQVTISVPDAAFNPGANKFDYELIREETAPPTTEEEETEPDENFTPGTVDREVGQLVGRFTVGEYSTTEIGAKQTTTVKVNDLSFCYPNVSKTITDGNPDNDQGLIDDPYLTNRKAYAANLDSVHEEFEYTITYRMNNVPLNFKQNPMLVDRVNYRLTVLDAYVTDMEGNRRDDFRIRRVTESDLAGNPTTVVVADIPKWSRQQTATVNEGEWGQHAFKRYQLHIRARLNDEYPFEVNQQEYIKILQESDSLGLLNQGQIYWNGESDSPSDSGASVRRSNSVFVLPPVETTINKKVRGTDQDVADGDDHYDLPLRSDEYYYDVKVAWPGVAERFEVEDTLVPELEPVVNTATQTGYDVEALVNGTVITGLRRYIRVEGNKITLALTKENMTRFLTSQINRANSGNLGPAEIHLRIKAKIREGANLDQYKDGNGVIKIPNQASVLLDDKEPKQSEVVTVTPDEPAIAKKINESLDDYYVPSWDQNQYTYNIKTTLPGNIRDYGTYQIKDVLDEKIELQEGQQPYIKGSDADHFDVNYDPDTRTITATMKSGSFSQIAGKSVVELVIPAKIKDGETQAKIPNTATVVYNKAGATGDPLEITTPLVTVTPPPSTPTKKINGDQDDLVIPSADQNAYTYNIKTKLPGNISDYTQWGIKDQLDPRLELQPGQNARIEGPNADKFNVAYDAATQTVTAQVKDGEFANLTGGEKIELVIPARVKDGITDKKIPNTATVYYNNPSDGGVPRETPPTPPVTVTPPPTTPDISKTVNDVDHYQLQTPEELFTYKIDTTVPFNATAFHITDELKDVLEFVGTPTATVDGQTIDASQITISGKTLKVSLSEQELKDYEGKAVHVEFQAKIVDGADLSAYRTTEDGTERVPNTAKYQINDNPALEKETTPVTVTPPPTTPEIKKTVNDKTADQLAEATTPFTYKIDTTVPRNAKAFRLMDTLEPVLQVEGTVTANIDGTEIPANQITVEDVDVDVQTRQRITVTLTEEQVLKNAEKPVHVQFNAKIKDKADLSAYSTAADPTIKVPNKASFQVDNKPEVESEPVTVTPPPTTPEITKTVNDASHYQLQAAGEEFTYKIDTTIPQNAVAFTVTDELKSVLDFGSGDVTATIDGVQTRGEITKNGQTLTVKFTREEALMAGKPVHIEFKAVVRADADLTDYRTAEDNTERIPNTARYMINDDPNITHETEPVTVTPPPTTPPITKTVNGADHAQLATKEEEFNYELKTTVPRNISEFKITDRLEAVLAVKGDVTATLDDQPIAASQIKVVEENGQQVVTVELTQEEVLKSAEKPVQVNFKAVIKEDADLSAYTTADDNTERVPNKASYGVNIPNVPDVGSNTVTVTPPPSDSSIEKKVDGEHYKKLDAADQVFNYTIDASVPKNATAFYVADSIVPELEFSGDVTATLDGTALDASHITKDEATGKITVTLTQDEAVNKADKVLHVSFNAKVREGAGLSGYIDNDVIMVPNTAQYSVNHQPEKDSNTVHITPPPTQPDIEKKVNDKTEEELVTPDATFNYTIDTTVPTHAATFTITDELKPELEFVGNAGDVTATVDGETITDVQINRQVLTVNLSQDQAAKKPGSKVHVSFNAKVREGANLKDYIVDGVIKVPNTAEYLINNEYKKTSTPVTVTPPPTDETITKTVNDKEEDTLETQESPFTYKVQATVPANATSFVVSDKLDPVLELNGDLSQVEAKLGDDLLPTSQISFDDASSTLKVTLTEDQAINNAKAVVTVTFQAKIKAGTTPEQLAPYIDATDGITRVPNKASYSVNHRPDVDSNTVKVTPPPTTPVIEKKVNDAASALLGARDEVFTYTIETTVPNNAYKFEIGDTIEPVLEFDGTATVELDGQDITATADVQTVDAKKTVGSDEVDTKRLVVNLTQDQVTQNPGKRVKVTFKAKIKAGADLSAYITDDGVRINNKANYMINNNPDITKDSNEVPVTPPPTTPDITKTVNDDVSALLGARDEVFTYKIETTVPENVTAFGVTDTLVDALEFEGDASNVTATVDGEAITDAKIEGQKLTVNLSKEQAVRKYGKAVHIEFKAKIKADADLTPYISDGSVKVPNTAGYDINNDPKFHKDSEPVRVTPPPTTPDIEKKVNGAPAATLSAHNEVFTYTIETTVPENATAFGVTDQLESVLEFVETPTATVGDETITDVTANTQTGLLTVNLSKDQAIRLHGQPVKVTFQAKIKDGANLNPYVVGEPDAPGSIKIPNKAQYRINNNPGLTKESEEVPVTPPPTTPDLVKQVNRADSAYLSSKEEVATYSLDTVVPNAITAFAVLDRLEPVLEFVDPDDVVATLDGQVLDQSHITIMGQTIRVALTQEEVTSNGGKPVHIEFKAKVREDADLTPYMTGQADPRIPNKGQYIINNNPDLIKDSNEVPIVPPTKPDEPIIVKAVNDHDQAQLTELNEEFTYSITTAMPTNAHAFEIRDTLEPVLEFVGEAEVTVNFATPNPTDIQVVQDGQHLLVHFSKEFVKANASAPVQVKFKAKIREGADLTPYMTSGVPSVPNQAYYRINNDPAFDKDSNIVPVTPPGPPVAPPGRKEIFTETGQTAEASGRLDLTAADQLFRYEIKAKQEVIPADAYHKQMKITDVLEPVLGVTKATIKITGEKIDVDQALSELKEVKDKLGDNEMKLKALMGEEDDTSNQASSDNQAPAVPEVDPAAQQRVSELEELLAQAQANVQAQDNNVAGLNEQLAALPAEEADQQAALQAQIDAASQAQAEANATVQDLVTQLEAARQAAQASSVITSQIVPEDQETPEQRQERIKQFENVIEELKLQIKEYEDGKDSQDPEKGKKYQAIKDFNEAIETRDPITGEMTEEAIAKLGEMKVVGNTVTFEITNEYVLKLLEGRNLRLVIYAQIVDQDAAKANYTAEPNKGYVPNKATVEFDHNPEQTNEVYVKPFTPKTPEQPTPPPTVEIPPATPGPELPATGELDNLATMLIGFVMALAGGYLTFRKRGNA